MKMTKVDAVSSLDDCLLFFCVPKAQFYSYDFYTKPTSWRTEVAVYTFLCAFLEVEPHRHAMLMVL